MDMYVINITGFFRYSFYQRFYAKYFQSYLQKIYMNRYKPIPEPLLTKNQYRLCQYCMYNLSYWLGVWKWILKKFTKVNKKHIYMSANLFKSLFFKNSSHSNTTIKMVFTMFITWNMLKKLTKKKALVRDMTSKHTVTFLNFSIVKKFTYNPPPPPSPKYNTMASPCFWSQLQKKKSNLPKKSRKLINKIKSPGCTQSKNHLWTLLWLHLRTPCTYHACEGTRPLI